MSSWRRHLLTLFPELRREATRPGFTINAAFVELLPLARRAHDVGDGERLRRVHAFAGWCLRQPANDLRNAAGVSLYEHLFDGPRDAWPEVVRWLAPDVVRDCRGLWEARLSPADFAEVERLIATRRGPLYETTRELSLGDADDDPAR